jgi:hypothetical protein
MPIRAARGPVGLQPPLGLPGRLSDAVDAPAKADIAATSARGWVRALLVAGHGLLATATLLLVVLAAIGAKAG